MATQVFDKQFVALTQLERAIALFEGPADYLSAITLAGAAEEILGKLVAKTGRNNSLQSRIEAGTTLHRHVFGRNVEQRAFADRANRARNSLKHLETIEGHTVSLDAQEEAADMINRAIDNYWLLNSALTPAMARFGPPRDET